ncbi:MAG TPA: hypothetical protein VK769_00115, partial [Verrucomicrobiae bacterium]|nr:hypothetical protein [Verrucomicrobiae bacterium]
MELSGKNVKEITVDKECSQKQSQKMDHSSFVHGLIVSVYLVILVALLALFLVWQQVPRRAIFEIVQIS